MPVLPDDGPTILQVLIEEDLTTVSEVARVTGRGESTVRRWARRESLPDVVDFHSMLAGLRSDEARRRLVHRMFSNLPVAINWVEDRDDAQMSEYDHATKALYEIACLMQRISQADKGDTESRADLLIEIEHLVGEAAAALFKVRDSVTTRLQRRVKARPVR